MGLAAESGQVSTSILVQIILATAGSGAVVAVVQGVFTRRKTQAEVQSTGATATKIITDAAASVVGTLQADNVALRTEVTAIRSELAEYRRTIEECTEWREEAAQVLRDHGIALKTPMPQMPNRAT